MQNMESHFERSHHNVWKQRPRKESPPSPSIADAFANADKNAAFDAVVELFVRHPALPLSLCSSKYFRKVLKGTCRVSRGSVRKAIIVKDARSFEQLKEFLRGKKVGIQIDGGKTVSKNKIIGICVVVDRVCCCFHIESVDDAAILTAAWYRDLLLNVISTLEGLGCIVVSVTLDNESSPNAGMNLVLEVRPYLIHNRCYPHTAELLIADLQSLGTQRHPTLPAIPLLHNVNENVHKLVTAILNSKYLRSALNLAQRNRAVMRPLSLVKPANTRKWSTAFLMLSRFCFLYNYIVEIEMYLAAGQAPEQCETDAKTQWIQVQKLLIPPRNHCDAVRELLYWIYVGEQAMQKDGASVIHATFIFEEICSSLENVLPTHRVPILIQADMDVARVQSLVLDRRTLLQSSGIYWLSLVLWPKATSYAFDHHGDACNELETFATRCWPQWQRNRAALHLPMAYHADPSNAVDTQSKLDAFINAVQEQLTWHLIPDHPLVLRHQASFELRSAAVATSLRIGDRVAKRGRVVPDGVDDDSCMHVHQYWSAVSSKLPLLSMIARLLLACCASEAGVERLFSKEGFIHNSYRNRLGHGFVLSLVRACMNRHALDDERLDLDSDESSEASDADE